MSSKRLLSCLICATSFLAVACGPAEYASAPAPAPAGQDPALQSASSEIIGGSTDTADAAVVVVYNNQGFLCTGSVIGPKVVLTAGHCSISQSSCSGSSCTALPASGYIVLGGTNPLSGPPDWTRNVTAVHPHPQLELTNNAITHDMAILILDQDAPVTPLAWQKPVDDTKYAPSTVFKGVGYGLANSPSGPDTSGTKRSVSLTIAQSATDAFQYGSASKNSCEGDSGGPAIETIGGVETVIGTVSYGDASCAQYGVDMRTDYNAAFIATYDPDASGPGGPGGGAKKKHALCSVAQLDPSAMGAMPLLGLGLAFAGVFAARRRRAA